MLHETLKQGVRQTIGRVLLGESTSGGNPVASLIAIALDPKREPLESTIKQGVQQTTGIFLQVIGSALCESEKSTASESSNKGE